MPDRYFVDTPIESGPVVLTGPEAHHLARVMRAKPGQAVVLFDGSGAEFDAEVLACERDCVRLRVLERREVDRGLSVAVTLLVAVCRDQRMTWLVEKCTELGAERIVPVLCERGVVRPDGAGKPNRWRRRSVEAAKQAGRTTLPTIDAPAPLPEATTAAPAEAVKLAAVPGAETPLAHACRDVGECAEAWLAVGPEGGFTPEEVQALREAGFMPVSLGPTILRVETAAVAMLSVVAALSARHP